VLSEPTGGDPLADHLAAPATRRAALGCRDRPRRRVLAGRWNQHGPDGLTDRRQDDGPSDTLAPEQQAQLFEALQGEPPDGGLWTAPKSVRFVKERWGIEVVAQTGWRWLREPGFSLRVPRPRHPGAATAEQQRVWL
jgi:transposase